jgi:hypothetical protein
LWVGLQPDKSLATFAAMSTENAPLKVVLCWHMHQPNYYDATRGSYRQPWTYLHGIKDYVDMAAHLEAEPRARAVVNFAPVLLDQLADYAAQVTAALADGTPIRDPLLQALAAPAPPTDPDEQRRLIQACRRAHETRVIDRFPVYRGSTPAPTTAATSTTAATWRISSPGTTSPGSARRCASAIRVPGRWRPRAVISPCTTAGSC